MSRLFRDASATDLDRGDELRSRPSRFPGVGAICRRVAFSMPRASLPQRSSARLSPVDALDRFLEALRPLLNAQRARAAYLIGSRARGTADPQSDIDVLIVAESERPEVERFKDYLPAIAASSVGVDLIVYTPAEFERMRAEERPFLMHALEGAKLIHEG
jgi:predicted nucleotidyltransferase